MGRKWTVEQKRAQSKRMRSKKFTPERIAQALTDSKGLVHLAAQKLGCNVTTVSARLKEFPEVRRARDAAKDGYKDYVENKLYEQIEAGKLGAIIFFLKTQARDRGYIEHLEVTVIPTELQLSVAQLCERHNVELSDLFRALIASFDEEAAEPDVITIPGLLVEPSKSNSK